MPRFLILRGGAIGDFILSLPGWHALKQTYPDSQIDIMGYPRMAGLVTGRHYAENFLSLDTAGFAKFFARNIPLPTDLCDTFSEYDLVISHLYDPDDLLRDNLLRAGVPQVVSCRHKPDPARPAHATEQFAEGLLKLAVFCADLSPRLFPSETDRAAAATFLQNAGIPPSSPLIAIHPGSGSPAKNWPLTHWHWVAARLPARSGVRVLWVTGDAEREHRPETAAPPGTVSADSLPLETLAALLQNCRVFLGHDSGISHLAAAVGTRVICLFGPSDPVLWAPKGPVTTVIRAHDGTLASISPEEVFSMALSDFP
ncbi:MAG: glycosyltransferase family 9 protein [Verrucomicrobiae bacterium]|nr:glycosyltransferase family 9 protein [Verrucomicrobiae bacterium]